MIDGSLTAGLSGAGHVLRLFGPPTWESGGVPVEIASSKGLALLCYVAARAERPVPRPELIALLWEDAPQEIGRHGLSSLLTRLRAGLPAWPLRPVGDGLAWDPTAGVDVDVAEFDAHAANRPTEAAALWRGPFLDGFAPIGLGEAFETWLRDERTAWDQRVMRVLWVALARARDEGAWRQALDLAQRALRVDPLQERAHRELMRAHAALGDRAAALAQFERCRALLRDDLGAEPDQRTIRLRDTIQEAGGGTTEARAAPARQVVRIPTPLTSFVGREEEIGQVLEHLRGARLLTLTGPGGSGKTRLAQAAAWAAAPAFPDGVYFVPLALLRDPTLVLSAIAHALDLTPPGTQPLLAALRERLAEREVLLVLDNCEQVAAAAPDLTELLSACAGVRVLATSRASLRVYGVRELPVPPLALPDRLERADVAGVGRSPAVALFVDRARDAQPGFALDGANAPLVEEICRRLDGLPLAIELAASRLRTLSLSDLAAGLRTGGGALPMLAADLRDRTDRQRTMRGTIAWSHDLLDSGGRGLFRQLAAFAGGFTPDAAVAVCGTDDVPVGLEELRAQSLLRRAEAIAAAAEARYTMLEVIHEFAAEQLHQDADADAVRARHAAHYGALAVAAEIGLHGPDHRAWLDRIETEHDNLRKAMDWAAENDLELALRIAAALATFWVPRGHVREGRMRTEALLARAYRMPVADDVVARALCAAGALALKEDANEEARVRFADALGRARRTDDQATVVAALVGLALAAWHVGEDPTALLDESLVLLQTLGDAHTAHANLGELAEVARSRGDLTRSRALHEENVRRCSLVGDVHGVAYSERNLGHLAGREGELGRAGELIHRSLVTVVELEDRQCTTRCLEELAIVASLDGRAAQALRLLGAATTMRRDLGFPPHPAARAEIEACLELARAELPPDDADALLAEGEALTLDEAIALAGDGEPVGAATPTAHPPRRSPRS